MAYKDGEIFETYCDKEYNKHLYRLIWKDGSFTDYDNYEVMRYIWYEYRQMAERVHVIDNTSGKGF